MGQVFRQEYKAELLTWEGLNPRLVGQVFRHLNFHEHGSDVGRLNPRLVGQVFRQKQPNGCVPILSLNPRLVGQIFRRICPEIWICFFVLIPD